MPTKTVAEVMGELATKNAELQADLAEATELLRRYVKVAPFTNGPSEIDRDARTFLARSAR